MTTEPTRLPVGRVIATPAAPVVESLQRWLLARTLARVADAIDKRDGGDEQGRGAA